MFIFKAATCTATIIVGSIHKKACVSPVNSARPGHHASGERAPFVTSRRLTPTGFNPKPGSHIRSLVAGGRCSQRMLPSSLPFSLPGLLQGRAGQGRVSYGWGDLALGEFFPALFSCFSSLHIHLGVGEGGAFMS